MSTKSSILAIGAHPDDVELGTFGSLLKWSKLSHITICVASDGEKGTPNGISRIEEASRCAKAIGANIIFLGLPDGFIPHNLDTVSAIDAVIKDCKPNRILIHHPDDLHQDHRHLSLSGISAARTVKELFFYETPSTTKSFHPNFFVNISREIETKFEIICKHRSQSEKPYFSQQAIYGAAAYRALSISRMNAHYEAFEAARFVID